MEMESDLNGANWTTTAQYLKADSIVRRNQEFHLWGTTGKAQVITDGIGAAVANDVFDSLGVSRFTAGAAATPIRSACTVRADEGIGFNRHLSIAAALPLIGLIIGIGGIRCYLVARDAHSECSEWDHNHSGTPFGGDKLVHCVVACLIGRRASYWCAALAAHLTGDCPGQPGADPNDHQANLDGVWCSAHGRETDNAWLDCQKCCRRKGYRRWA